MKNNILPIIIAIFLVIALFLLSDPFMIWMPDFAVLCLLVLAAALLLIWAGFVLRERAVDEREALHRMNAGRAAYLAGLAVLTVGLVVQGLSYGVDPWLSLGLGVMVVVKLVARLYFDRHR